MTKEEYMESDLIKNIIILLEDAEYEMKSRKDKRIIKDILKYINNNVVMIQETNNDQD